MKKFQIIILMITISAITLIGREVIDRYVFPNIAHAQSTQATQSRGQTRWEYCALTLDSSSQNTFGSSVHYATIRYYQSSGWRTEKVELESSEFEGYRLVIGKAIAKLGDEGWEMALDYKGQGSTNLIYFKRLKQ